MVRSLLRQRFRCSALEEKMYQYRSIEEFETFLESQSALPRGFRCSTEKLEFFPAEKDLIEPLSMTLSLIALDKPTESFAGIFTKNALPGYPVLIGRELIKQKTCRGVIVNNKIANVCSPGGLEDSNSIRESLESLTGGEGFFFPSSTGIIGWKLPREEIKKKLPALVENLQSDTILPAARGIMTTDAFPKIRTGKVGKARITAIAKGAGMIEPNMATMLVFILTDADLPRDFLQKSLKEASDQSFNRLSIDSDQSTSDSALLLSSEEFPVDEIEFQSVLDHLCLLLADDIVRNGEGTGHVIEVTVNGAERKEDALGLCKALVNSPLTKTAIYGNDPNVGRFLQALGDYAGNHGLKLKRESIQLKLGGSVVFQKGSFQLNEKKEQQLSDYLKDCSLETPCPGYPSHGKRVELEIELGLGSASARVLGSDLSYEYIRENADYRS